MADCLAGIISRYKSGTCDLKLPPPGNTLAPWVKVKFKKAGNTITVGNQSSPQNPHHACIVNFAFGYSTGGKCRIEIHDEQGGSFVQFVEDMLRDIKEAHSGALTMEIQFGWVNSLCPNGVPAKSSPKFVFYPSNNITSFEGGKIKYIIEGQDMFSTGTSGQTRISKTFGERKSKGQIPIKEAITKLFQEEPEPTIASVEFLERACGTTKPLRFIENGENGPLGVWEGNNLTKLGAAQAWLRTTRTINNKGFRVTWDTTDPGGKIIVWEDYHNKCEETKPFDCLCQGFYIVNGGKCSNVLKFDPKMEWKFEMLGTSGGNISQGSVAARKKQGRQDDCPDLSRPRLKDVGGQRTIPPIDNLQFNLGKKATEEHDKSQTVNDFANIPFAAGPVDVEMQIVGDPNLISPNQIAGQTAAVAVVNPFHIITSGLCGEWLARPGCNEVLSNKAWWIEGVHHFIKQGEFVTTLKLKLLTPGSLLNLKEPFGGIGSGGFVPPV